jgi:hypothetical protein
VIQLVLPELLQATLEAIAEGASTQQIARRNFLSPNTVKDRLAALYRELGAKDRANAVAIGFRVGVLSGRRPALPCVLAKGVPMGALVAGRERSALTLQVMAGKLGVSAEWLRRHETGMYPVPLLVAQRYAAIVGIGLEEP